jgi:hypothetical protein
VAIPAGLLLVTQVLLEHAGATVPVEHLIATYAACNGTNRRSSVRTALLRLRARVEPLGLELESVGQRAVRLRALPLVPPA